MWNLLSQNISPRVIVLIEKKIEEENNLSEEELQNMSIKKKYVGIVYLKIHLLLNY